MVQSVKRGLFIVFEGLDRSGKSTQKKMLCDVLQGIELNFPNRTANESGRLLDLYLQNKGGNAMCDEAVHILFSMNRWESKPKIVGDMK